MNHFKLLCVTAACCLVSCASPEVPPPPAQPAPVPDAALQAVVDELMRSAGAPGALLGVSHGGEHRLFAAGTEDRPGLVPLETDAVFRAGSITKLLTGSLVLRQVERKALRLSDPLALFVPDFPHADAITLDALLSHTSGVTTRWLFDPDLQPLLLADLTRHWTLDDVIALLAQQPPAGTPGTSGVQYANGNFILLAKVLEQATGESFERLLTRDVLEPLGLASTSYPLDTTGRVISGTFELGGVPVDTNALPQTAALTAAGPSGALHTTLDDLLRVADALFRDERLVNASSLRHMLEPAEPGADYGHALMLFCPCVGEGAARRSIQYGHGGHVPGFWSVLVHDPKLALSMVLVINRDSVNGTLLERSVFDPSLMRLTQLYDASSLARGR